MGPRIWWWVGFFLDFILLFPGSYMAMGAFDIAMRNEGSPTAIAVASLFSALPIFCVLSPWAARRALMRARSMRQIAVLLATPWVYAVFLMVFLFSG